MRPAVSLDLSPAAQPRRPQQPAQPIYQLLNTLDQWICFLRMPAGSRMPACLARGGRGCREPPEKTSLVRRGY